MHRILGSSRVEHQQEVSSVSGEVILSPRGDATDHLEWRDQAVERKISGTTTGRTGVFLSILALPPRYARSRQPSLPRLQRMNARAYTTGTDTCCRTSERPDRVPQLNQAAGLVPESSDETGSQCRPAPRWRDGRLPRQSDLRAAWQESSRITTWSCYTSDSIFHE